MQKIEHIGIAVKSIAASSKVFDALLGHPMYKTETVESEGVRTAFYEIGGVKIELLEATRDDSPIAKFIEKRGEGIHHLAFHVEQIEPVKSHLQDQGFVFIQDEPKEGADNKRIVFIHPKSAHGTLVELCEEIS